MDRNAFHVVGERRRNLSRRKLGEFLFLLWKSGKSEYVGFKSLCGLLSTDPRTLKRNIGFRFEKHEGGPFPSALFLTDEDKELIAKTLEAFEYLREKDAGSQKIAKYVFMYLLEREKNG